MEKHENLYWKCYSCWDMIGRNRNWSGPSDWIQKFNEKHNPDFYGKEEKQEKNKKKNQKQKDLPFKFKIFRQSD